MPGHPSGQPAADGSPANRRCIRDMGKVEHRPMLYRATFRAAAVSLWGLGGIVMASNFLGHDQQVNYGIEWIITGASIAAGFLAWFWPWAALPAQRFLPVVFGGLVIN